MIHTHFEWQDSVMSKTTGFEDIFYSGFGAADGG